MNMLSRCICSHIYLAKAGRLTINYSKCLSWTFPLSHSLCSESHNSENHKLNANPIKEVLCSAKILFETSVNLKECLFFMGEDSWPLTMSWCGLWCGCISAYIGILALFIVWVVWYMFMSLLLTSVFLYLVLLTRHCSGTHKNKSSFRAQSHLSFLPPPLWLLELSHKG